MSYFKRLLVRGLRRLGPPPAPPPPPLPPLSYSWILTNELAIGPMPGGASHWLQLEDAGFRSRFSCCYPNEKTFSQVPPHWSSNSVSLPDHRQQEQLSPERLLVAIDAADAMINERSPLYLHCFAGRERSSIVAIGLTARRRSIDLFEALEWVRRCHPTASPIYEHLDILEGLIRKGNI